MKYYIKNLYDSDQREAEDISELDDILLKAYGSSGVMMQADMQYLCALDYRMRCGLGLSPISGKFFIEMPAPQFDNLIRQAYSNYNVVFPFTEFNTFRHLNLEIKSVDDYATYSIKDKAFVVGNCRHSAGVVKIVFSS
jgi:hypothetical protein